MADAFKMMSRDGGKSMGRMAQMMGMGGPGGGMPGGGAMPSQADLSRLMGGGGPKLPGLGGGLPGLPFGKPKP